MWAGCYSLDLYCDNADGGPGHYHIQKNGDLFDDAGHYVGEFPVRLTGETGSSLRRKAREWGWVIRADGSAVCPKCSGNLVSGDTDG